MHFLTQSGCGIFYDDAILDPLKNDWFLIGMQKLPERIRGSQNNFSCIFIALKIVGIILGEVYYNLNFLALRNLG